MSSDEHRARSIRTATDLMAVQVTEPAVGIMRYMSDAPGFTGSLKARYSDFCVNEINLDGSVVHLREQLHPPRAPKRSRVPEESAGAAEEAGALPSQGDGGGGGGDAGSAPTAADVDAEGGTTAGLGVGASVHPAAADHAGSASDGTTGAAKHAEHAQQLQELEAVAGTAAAAMLRDFLNAATAATPVEQVPAMLFPPSEDKHYRRALHEAVKRLFPFLVGDTADDPAGSAGKCVRVRVNTGGRGSKRRREGDAAQPGGAFDPRSTQEAWPADRPHYLAFTLLKENVDSMAALNAISRAIGVRDKTFTFGGTKDKRAVTVQRVTAYKVTEERLAQGANACKGVWLGDCEYVPQPIKLGQTKGMHVRLTVSCDDVTCALGAGNEFTIVVRDVHGAADEDVLRAVQTWAGRGFINYFGLQRFGTSSVPTHTVGRAMLQRQWKQAVRLIMDPRPGEWDAALAARQYYRDTSDVGGTLRRLPRHMFVERSLLQGLEKHGPRAFAQALLGLPQYVRSLYHHSYQSYLWNMAASARLEHHSNCFAVEGDLVLLEGGDAETGAPGSLAEEDDGALVGEVAETAAAEGEGEGEGAEAADAEAADAVDDASADDAAAGTEAADEDSHATWAACSADDRASVRMAGDTVPRVRRVTKEEEEAQSVSIDRVVLPLLGYATLLPRNVAEAAIRRELEADGLVRAVLDPSTHGIVAMRGGYRLLVQRPIGAQWRLMNYSNPRVDIAYTDISRLRGELDQVPESDGPLRALWLRFQLPPSTYATMCLRELMKQPSHDAQYIRQKVEAQAAALATTAPAAEPAAPAAEPAAPEPAASASAEPQA